MRIAFTTTAVPGHLNPTTTLARHLRSHGHDCLLLGLPDCEPAATAAGLEFVPLCAAQYPAGSIASLARQLSRLQGTEAIRFTLKALSEILDATLRDGSETVTANGIEALVVDQVTRGFELVPMALALPYVHICNALHYDYSGMTPLATFDYPYDPTPEGLARNRLGLESTAVLREPISAVQRAYANRMSLAIKFDLPFPTISPRACITQTPKAFDFPASHWPPQFHHAGPFHDMEGRIPVDFPWHRLTGEPLIYASMGTLQNGLESVFHTIISAVSRIGGHQLVLSAGPNLDLQAFATASADTIIVKRAPQLELLKRASLCITHAGLNTALESLAQGVPLVAIPVTNDQPGVAARIAYTGTGAFVTLRDVTSDRLTGLLQQVLTNPDYRANARSMKRQITEVNGLALACNLIEQAFKPTSRASASSH